MKKLPSRQHLKTLLDYDPLTGQLTWKQRPESMFPSPHHARAWNTRYAGQAAFTSTDRKGYHVGAIDDQHLRAHRVIYMLMTGQDPQQIDHIDGDPANNRWANLRSILGKHNQLNMKRAKNNTSGTTGVRWHEEKERWQAYITIDRRRHYLGYFDHEHEAITARKAAEKKYGFHPNHGR